MPINPQHSGNFTFKDASDETSRFSFHFGAITAASLPGFLTEFGALRAATEAITLGALVGDQWSGDITKYNNAIPADPNAQRERKFLVTYQDDSTFATYTSEIPTADFTGRLLAGTDRVDLTETDVAAWITAYEQLARSPEGNTVAVIDMFGVGRNL